jgi:hypothetical protein
MDWNRFSAGLWLLIFVGYHRAFTTFGRLTPNGSPERFYFPLVGGDLTEESSAVRSKFSNDMDYILMFTPTRELLDFHNCVVLWLAAVYLTRPLLNPGIISNGSFPHLKKR